MSNMGSLGGELIKNRSNISEAEQQDRDRQDEPKRQKASILMV